MTQAPTIWISNKAGHPYHKALKTVPGAELKALTKGNVNPLRLDRLNDAIAEGIVLYTQPDDYLIISGTPTVPTMCVLLWMMQHGRCNILQWNATQREYEKTTLVMEDLKFLLEDKMVRG